MWPQRARVTELPGGIQFLIDQPITLAPDDVRDIADQLVKDVGTAPRIEAMARNTNAMAQRRTTVCASVDELLELPAYQRDMVSMTAAGATATIEIVLLGSSNPRVLGTARTPDPLTAATLKRILDGVASVARTRPARRPSSA